MTGKEAGHYTGYSPSAGEEIARIAHISPEKFYEDFVRLRRPVVLKDCLSDDERWRGSKWSDLSYLRQVCRSSRIKIEPVDPSSGAFGSGATRKEVSFPEFLDILEDEKQRGKWYLTTQYEEGGDVRGEDEDGEDERNGTADTPMVSQICPPPTDQLLDDFPLHPKLTGNLVLQQCNLWIGNSSKGTSSGLHHDFHDNLYLLLRGRKRFVLYPPSAHPYLHLRGRISRLHPNGLLSYDLPSSSSNGGVTAPSLISPGTTSTSRADGLDPVDAAKWCVRHWERRLREAEGDATAGDATTLEIVKERYEAAMDALLEAKLSKEDGEEEEQGWQFFDQVEGGEAVGDEDEEDDEDEDGDVFAGGGDDDSEGQAEDGEALLARLGPIATDVDDDADGDPPSFSRIPPVALHKHLSLLPWSGTSSESADGPSSLSRQTPTPSEDDVLLPLPGCPPPLIVHLEAGEILYLPASWFHEVTSSTSPATTGGVHAAFNYWFHPPDGHCVSTAGGETGAVTTTPPGSPRSSDAARLPGTSASKEETGTFERPYKDMDIWEEMRRAVQSEVAEMRRRHRGERGQVEDEGEGKGKGKRKAEGTALSVDEVKKGKTAV